MGLEIGVDALGIGFDGGARPGGEKFEGPFRQAVKAKRAHETVGPEGAPAEDFGQPPGAGAPDGLHLPQAVLGVDESEGEIGVVRRFCPDVGNGVAVPEDGDRSAQAGNSEDAVKLGQGGPQPEIPATEAEQEKEAQKTRSASDPAPRSAALHHRRPLPLTIMSSDRPAGPPSPFQGKGDQPALSLLAVSMAA